MYYDIFQYTVHRHGSSRMEGYRSAYRMADGTQRAENPGNSSLSNVRDARAVYRHKGLEGNCRIASPKSVMRVCVKEVAMEEEV